MKHLPKIVLGFWGISFCLSLLSSKWYEAMLTAVIMGYVIMGIIEDEG